jgi:hypothetical protein
MMARANTAMRRYLHYLGKINDWISNKTLQNRGGTLCHMCVRSSNVQFYVKSQEKIVSRDSDQENTEQ